LTEKAVDGYYILIIDGVEKDIYVPIPTASDALKEQLLKLQLVHAELPSEFYLVNPSTMQPYRTNEIVPFGKCLVERPFPPEELPGTQERLPIHRLRRIQRDVNAKTVYVLDAQTIVELVKATLTKDHKFQALFQTLDCAFITTETTRAEVLRILKKENILVRWDVLLPLARTFHVVTDAKPFKKYEAASNILRLPPFGSRESDFLAALMYMEAVVCATALPKGDMVFLSCSYVVVRKCHLNPMWLRTLCGVPEIGEPVAIQRFASQESRDNPLILLQRMSSGEAAEDDLTSPFQTQGFIDDHLQAALHTNLEGNVAFLPLTYMTYAPFQAPYFSPEAGFAAQQCYAPYLPFYPQQPLPEIPRCYYPPYTG